LIQSLIRLLAAVNDEGKTLGSPSYTVNAGFQAEVTDRFSLFGQLRYFTDQAAFSRIKNDFEEVDDQVYIDLTATYQPLFGQNNIDLGFTIRTSWIIVIMFLFNGK
jgi:hypothetical protein